MRFAHHRLRHGAVLALLAGLTLSAGAQPAGKAGATRKATPIKACDPQWPDSAPVIVSRRATKLMVNVNAEGVVTGTRLLQSSNSEPLDKATVEAAMGCQFAPALKQGKRVASAAPFSFKWDQYVVVQEPPPVAAPITIEPASADFASCSKPIWPRVSLRNEETGTVTMDFLISAEGIVKDSKIIRSTGFKELDNSALSAIAKCRFKPATEAGQPVEAWAKIQYVWALE